MAFAIRSCTPLIERYSRVFGNNGGNSTIVGNSSGSPWRIIAIAPFLRPALWLSTCILAAVMVDPVGNALEKYMDLLSTRQKLIVSNIANADTPGYKTRDVDFQTQFQNLLSGGQSTAVEVGGLKTTNDGNNVSLDREARLLSENALRFNIAAQLMKSQFSTLKNAIDEGKNG
jgi:flagellar basal-body rod protein FlgB